MTTSNNISEFVQEKFGKANLFDLLVYGSNNIQTTSQLAYYKPSLKPVTAIKPKAFTRILKLSFGLFFFIIGVLMTCIFCFFASFLAVFGIIWCGIVYKFLLKPLSSRDFRESIVLDTSGLTYTGSKLSWSLMNETYILRKHQGRLFYSYLLVEMHDQSVTMIDLESFPIGDEKFASLIEVYKRNKQLIS